MLPKSKLNSIETLTSQVLIDRDISHEEFVTILKEKDKYDKIKDNLRSENGENKIMRLSGVKSNQRFKWNIIEYFMSSKKIIFFLLYV